MDISFIDYLANKKAGAMRKCSVATKLFLCISCLVVCLTAKRLSVLLSMFVVLFVLNLSVRMPIAKLLHFMFYPLFFSIAFVFMKLFYDPYGAVVILLKAVTAVLSMLLFLTTTPFTELFSFLGKLFPKVIVSSLFFTYRIFFVLVQKLSDALRTIKLRGGFRLSNLFFYLKSIVSVLGSIFIGAFDMSERMSMIYAIRGFDGKVYAKADWKCFSIFDLALVLFSLAVIGFGIYADLGGALWLK